MKVKRLVTVLVLASVVAVSGCINTDSGNTEISEESPSQTTDEPETNQNQQENTQEDGDSLPESDEDPFSGVTP